MVAKAHDIQDIIRTLQDYWAAKGCAVLQPLDLPVGAGTFHPATTLRALGPDPWQAVYVQPSRRPADGRFGRHPNRLQRYYQLQVVLKPSPDDFQDLYLASLAALGISGKDHDIRFIEDDWKSPTLGAWGLGWEVWCDGMEVTQFTYFQEVGGIQCEPVLGEITYGIERLAMYLQDKDSVYDLQWNDRLTYGDLYHRNEVEHSHYNTSGDDTDQLQARFQECLGLASSLLDREPALVLPAYEAVLESSHLFNLLDARGALSVNERGLAITDIRTRACAVASSYVDAGEVVVA